MNAKLKTAGFDLGNCISAVSQETVILFPINAANAGYSYVGLGISISAAQRVFLIFPVSGVSMAIIVPTTILYVVKDLLRRMG